MTAARFGAWVVLALASGALAVGCGSGGDDAVGRIETLDPSVLPETLLGLPVEAETVEIAAEGLDRSLLDGVALGAIRDGETLVGTLEVGRFADDVVLDDPGFRENLVLRLGSVRPHAFPVAGREVWLTEGTVGELAVWFGDDSLHILGIRPEFERPRALVRAALTASTAP